MSLCPSSAGAPVDPTAAGNGHAAVMLYTSLFALSLRNSTAMSPLPVILCVCWFAPSAMVSDPSQVATPLRTFTVTEVVVFDTGEATVLLQVNVPEYRNA